MTSPSQSPHDYSAFPSGDPEPATLAQIRLLVDEAHAAELEVAAAEEALRAAKDRLRDVVERRLPEAMDSVGLEQIQAGGLVIRIEDDLQVKQPPRSQREAAHAWLRQHDQGGLVRTEVAVPFGPGLEEQERARALLDSLGLGYPQATKNEEVNSTSLKAFLRRALRDGESPPLELFGARAFRVAKITDK